MIRYCPNCASKVKENERVFTCDRCKGKYYSIELEKPEKEKVK